MKASTLLPFLLTTSFFWGNTHIFAKSVKWTHYGHRPLAMGNAYVGVADDYNVLFYNPAGITHIKEWDMEILNFHAEVSKSTLDFASKISTLQSGDSDNLQEVIDLVEAETGNSQHLALGITPHLVIPSIGFGLGIGLDLNTTVVFHRYPTVDFKFGPEVILPIVYGFDLVKDTVAFGLGLKMRAKGGIDREFSIQDFEALSSSNNDQASTANQPELEDYVEGGFGFGVDAGFLFTPSFKMNPTLGISMTDIGGTPFAKTDVSGEALGKPDTILPSLNLGLSLKPLRFGRSSYWMVSADAHSINQPFSFSKKLNLGTEINLWDYLKFQGGFHQGYMTAGMQLDIPLLTVRILTYAEELGETAGTLEDRRYAISLKLLI